MRRVGPDILGVLRKDGSGAVTIEAGGVSLRSEYAFGANGVAVRMDDPAGGSRPTYIVGGTVYLPKDGTTDQWVSASVDATDEASAMGAGVMTLFAGFADPALFIGSAAKSGTATVVAVDGSRVTYQLTDDVPGSGPSTLTLVLDDGRPVSATAKVDAESVTLTYSDVGAVGPVSAPPADKVTPLTTS